MAENIDFELTKPVAANEPRDGQTPEIRDLEKIMKSEESAVEAFRQVLKKFPDYAQINDLKSIFSDHEKAVEFWKTQLRSKAAPIEESTGPWKEVVETFSGTHKLSGNSSTLKSLRDGEEHGLKEYEELNESNNLSFQSMAFIKNICLDQQRKHLAVIDGLMEK